MANVATAVQLLTLYQEEALYSICLNNSGMFINTPSLREVYVEVCNIVVIITQDMK